MNCIMEMSIPRNEVEQDKLQGCSFFQNLQVLLHLIFTLDFHTVFHVFKTELTLNSHGFTTVSYWILIHPGITLWFSPGPVIVAAW